MSESTLVALGSLAVGLIVGLVGVVFSLVMRELIAVRKSVHDLRNMVQTNANDIAWLKDLERERHG